MIGRWLYYFALGWRDLVRLRSTTQHHVIIVAGICLPILMLLGLKRGHVETLRQDLITSPTGRQITFWSARKGELMDRSAIERLTSELSAVEVIVPDTQRVVRLRSRHKEEFREIKTATLYATRPGDPLLAQLRVSAPKRGSRGIIISEAVAQQLAVLTGKTVTVVLSRGRADQAETAEVECPVVGVMPTEELSAAIAYVDLDLLDQFDAYIRGYRVREFGWSSAKTSAADTYSGYLIFCEAGNDLSDSDRRYLADRGFELTNRTADPPSPLARLLVGEHAAKLIIYHAQTERSARDPQSRLRLAPSELSEATEADDVVLPWNHSLTADEGGRTWEMVGLSMPRRTWLREYFANSNLPFDYEAEPLQGRHGEAQLEIQKINWPLSPAVHVNLSVARASETPPPEKEAAASATEPLAQPLDAAQSEESRFPTGAKTQTVIAVPANLLAWISAHRSGLVDYDPEIQLFVPRFQPAIYDRARLYANTIDDVPAVVRALAKRQFAVMSETGRILEIHRQDESLQLLVWVVGFGVFLFGIATVFSVLMDSTDRKRGTIGVLRVMGMSRSGIFISILLRAAAIGAAAAVVSLVCGWLLALALGWSPGDNSPWFGWKPIMAVQLTHSDLILVALGAMACCCLGAVPPAWKASRLDPFDAIVQGRFR